jgi:hypothetical protein
MRCSFATVLAVLFAGSSALAQVPTPQSGVFIQQNTPQQRMYPSEGTLEFERVRVDFAPQSLGVENCVNIPLNNTTDHPRVLLHLLSLEPNSFYISSPAESMLPLTIGGNSSLYINICFKATKLGEYKSSVLAIFQDDTVRLGLIGKGIAAPTAAPIPKETKLIVTKGRKKHESTIQIDLSRRAVVRLNLENSLGKTLRSFPFDDIKTPGVYQVTFDEKSDAGKRLDRGTYYLRMEVVDLDAHTTSHDSKTITIRN